jgi:hypothetical protein
MSQCRVRFRSLVSKIEVRALGERAGSDRNNASASSSFLRMSLFPLSSCSAEKGTFFIASTAASRSPERPPLISLGAGPVYPLLAPPSYFVG